MKPQNAAVPENPAAGHIVAVGRITLRPDASRLRFFMLTLLSILQAKRAPGNIHVSTHAAGGAHFSMSAWRSDEAMRAFAQRGAHLRAMRAITALALEGEFRHWRSAKVPSWPEALARFHAEPPRQPDAHPAGNSALSPTGRVQEPAPLSG
ncbi:MAG: hypothetical protein JJT95_04300 [Pararhodobacter sp.]|nr:hypothetical protein [Pararhodobacter sp.]